ncbi:MAG TPA: metalloprotease PmbA [Gammaproteobacteria bacterium]|nr:metalloprotease PmbA [Gammaproteobacteria bacterium]HET7587584.1 metalloprotease PmbA [Gammaproteobacteria bacterium]
MNNNVSSTYTQADLEQLVADVLRQAKECGASQAEAGVGLESGLSLNVRLGEVETLEYQRDRSFGVTVYFGHSKGSASSADFSPQALKDTVQAACSIARYTADDPAAGLADAELMAREIPDLDLCHPWDLDPDQAIELALSCENTAREFDPRIQNSEGAAVNSHRGLHVYGNSHGFIGAQERTQHTISCSMIARDGDNMQRDDWYTIARDAAELESPEAVGRRASERAVKRLGARRLSTRRAPVLFVPELARGLIGHFLGAIRGGAQYRRSSFLLDAVDTQVFPEFLNISERPHLPRALGSAAFDGEGVATRDRELIAGGVLQHYLLNSYSARKLGLQTTGHAGGVHNLLLSDGSHDFDALLRQMDTGLVVTELMGQGVNGVTGDYSRGAVGFWVENGQIAYPVEEITIAGNLRDMYRHIVAIGNDVDARGSIRTGSVLIESMTIAGE